MSGLDLTLPPWLSDLEILAHMCALCLEPDSEHFRFQKHTHMDSQEILFSDFGVSQVHTNVGRTFAF